jgi:uncharacterized delta-60 repeat protein
LTRSFIPTTINFPATKIKPVSIMKKNKYPENQTTNSPPEPDPSFGTGGIVYIPSPMKPPLMLDALYVVAAPNTSINQLIYVVCWNASLDALFYLVRLLENGEIDRSFGDNGYATIPTILTTPARLRELIFFSGSGAITGISEILFTNSWWVPGATRFKPSGSLDRSFSFSGYRHFPPPWLLKSDKATTNNEKADVDNTPWLNFRVLVEANITPQLNIQPNGKMLFLARYRQYPNGYVAGVYQARIHLDGMPDETFGQNGFVKIEDPADPDFLIDARIYDIDRRGGMVVFADRRDTGIVLRYDAEGSLDQSFGNGGIVVIDDSVLGGRAIAIKAVDDGAILIVFQFDGLKEDPPYPYFYPAVIKLLRDGRRDPTFNNGDPLKLDDIAPDARLMAVGMTLDAGNRIMLSGYVDDGPMNNRGFLARLLPNGTRDADFGVNGLAIRQDMLRFSPASIQNGTKILLTTGLPGDQSVARFIA